MPSGPFQSHPVSAAVIQERAEAIADAVDPLTGLRQSVVARVAAAAAAVTGDLLAPVTLLPRPLESRTRELAQTAVVAAGAVRLFGSQVARFDAGVDALNARWADAQAHGFGVPLTDGPPAEHAAAVSAARSLLLEQLRLEHSRLERDLDDGAEESARLLDGGPTASAVVSLYRAGALPLVDLSLFPDVRLSVGDHLRAAWAALQSPPGEGGGLTLEEILTDYQVRDDPGGLVYWEPGWPANEFTEPVRVTASEAEMLAQLGLLALRDMRDIKDGAFNTADDRFDTVDRNDDHNDAFRHAYWNALLTRRFGEDWARAYTDAHEGVPGNTETREAMDLYNNGVGRRIAAANPDADEDELADLIEQAVRNGEVLVIGPDGELAWSNTVPQGSTGDAEQGAEGPPGGNPDIDPDENADPDSHNDGGTGS